LRDQIGKGGDQILPTFLSKSDLAEKGKEIEKFRSDLFKERYLSSVRPFPKVRELFQELLSRGFKVGLASSGKPEEVQKYKKIAGIEESVHTEVSSGDAERSKPHPDIFEAALDRLGEEVKPEEVVAIGDSPYDMTAAKKVGLQRIAVFCGGFPETRLRQAGAERIYADPADLLAHCGEWAPATASSVSA
jgi:HAD superfamily hydrolase (TIGR01549 family)